LSINEESVKAIEWAEPQLKLLDQRLLPREEVYLLINSVQSVFDAIRDMVVRGAPAIGIVAAYGVVFAARDACEAVGEDESGEWVEKVKKDIQALRQSRPTAINLFWALDRMAERLEGLEQGEAESSLLALAKQIHQEDWEANKVMGELGAELIANSQVSGSAILTHCNAGALATGGYGTALGVVRSGFKRGVITKVYADETRPWMQGARLTAWELIKDDIPCCLLADSLRAPQLGNELIKAGILLSILGGSNVNAGGKSKST